MHYFRLLKSYLNVYYAPVRGGTYTMLAGITLTLLALLVLILANIEVILKVDSTIEN